MVLTDRMRRRVFLIAHCPPAASTVGLAPTTDGRGVRHLNPSGCRAPAPRRSMRGGESRVGHLRGEELFVAASAVMTRRLSLSWLVPAGVLVAALLLFGPDMLLWWRVWRDPDSFYAHGPVVPVLAGLLIWIDWKRLKSVVPRPSLWGLMLVIPSLLLVTLSRWTSIYFFAEFAWLLFVAGAVWMLHGRRMLRALLGPIAIMFFCLPMPSEVIEPISLPIQEYSPPGPRAT